ncbi:MAG: 50S ribosomal protein L11 methyltransferase [Rhodospirillaceae bacterium]|nr:50S ribosomal protein L11 methyltransferase [Rhodospirillaceae bacterium]
MKPVRVSPQLFWAVRLECPFSDCDLFASALADIAVAVSSYEVNEHARPEAIWGVEGLFVAAPARSDIVARIALAASAANRPEPAVRIEEIAPRDWLKESYASFRPIRAGRFYVFGDHITAPPPAEAWPLRVNASTAFGSGAHESTYGCLLALDRLRRLAPHTRAVRRRAMPAMLDLGCGSGILAMAMAKAWRRPVVAADIDPEAVRVTTYNVRRNRESALVKAVMSDGLTARDLRRKASFALITANILARPLCKFAPGLAARLARGGFLVLAGLLSRQEAMVIAAYRAQGMRLYRRIALNGWSTLILRR